MRLIARKRLLSVSQRFIWKMLEASSERLGTFIFPGPGREKMILGNIGNRRHRGISVCPRGATPKDKQEMLP